MYFFERTLTGEGPSNAHCVGPAPPDTATSIQAPFGCPANPAHTPTPTHTTLLVPSKHRAAAIQAQFGCPANPVLLVVHFGTHTPTPTHTTLLVVAPKHPSAALPTQRWWCMRWNVCASAVRSCSCGTTNTTHSKNISLRCALGCGKKVSSQKPFSSLQSHEIQTAAIPIKRRYELHPGTQTTSSWFILGHTHQHQHTLHCTQASCGCHANPALVVHALEGLRLCCSILLMRDNQHNTQQKHFTSLCPAPCIKPTV